MPEGPLNPALEAAAALSGNAALVGLFRKRPLPDGVGEVLQMLAGLGSRQIDPNLRVQLEFYVQNVLLHPGASPHRVLGVEPGAPRPQMRANMRSLMLWLHPDAAGEDWRAAFAPRVLDAWRSVCAPEHAVHAPFAPQQTPSMGVPVRPRQRRRGRPLGSRPPSSTHGRRVRRRLSWRRVSLGLVAVLGVGLVFGAYILAHDRPYTYTPSAGLWGRLVSW